MFGKGKELFRTKALDRISSPESLDQLMELVAPKDWISIVVLGALLAGIIAWSIAGRLPTAVMGHGVLIRPRKIIEVQSVGAGRLATFNVRVGDAIKEGELVADIDQMEARRRLEEDRALLADLESQDRAKSTLRDQELAFQRQQDQAELRLIQIQRDNLVKNQQDAQAMTPELKRRLDSLQRLRSRDLIPELSSDLLAAQQAYADNLAHLADLKARVEQLDTQAAQYKARDNERARETLETTTARRNQIKDLTAKIAVSDLETQRSSAIRADHGGKVLEVFVHAGELIAAGSRVLSMEVDDGTTGLVAVTYFPVKDGKKVQSGMPIQVIPDTVERQRFGGIVGKVVSVSAQPVTHDGALSTIGNSEIVQSMMAGGPVIEVLADLQRDATTYSGYKWSSSRGPELKMTSGLTGAARVTIEGRAPITFVFPFLRSLSGVY